MVATCYHSVSEWFPSCFDWNLISLSPQTSDLSHHLSTYLTQVKDELDLSGIYDIYNRRSFGVTEADIVAAVFGGVRKVIEMEKKREAEIEWKSGGGR